MINYNSEIQSWSGATTLKEQHDGWWMIAPDLDVIQMVKQMKEWQARFSTMTGSLLPNEETAVIYHYCLDKTAYNFKVYTHENKIQSISNVLPAAEWIEREIQDLYKVQFINHPHPERLLRPLQMESGLFREPGGAEGKNKRLV
jgi:NADH:ubiquinone oxidoreductase subunit C